MVNLCRRIPTTFIRTLTQRIYNPSFTSSHTLHASGLIKYDLPLFVHSSFFDEGEYKMVIHTASSACTFSETCMTMKVSKYQQESSNTAHGLKLGPVIHKRVTHLPDDGRLVVSL